MERQHRTSDQREPCGPHSHCGCIHFHHCSNWLDGAKTIYHSEGRIHSACTFISQEIKCITGYTPQEFTEGQISLTDLIHPEDIPSVQNILTAATERDEPFCHVYRIGHRDGTWRWVQDSGAPSTTPNGKSEIRGLIHDITDSIRNRQKLEGVAEAIEQCSEGLLIINTNNEIEFANSALAEMHGRSPQQLQGQPLSILYPESDNFVSRPCHKQLWEGQRFCGQVDHIRSDGSLFQVLCQCSVVRETDGSIAGAVMAMRDLTEKQKSDQQLQILQWAVEQSNEGIAVAGLDGKFLFSNQAFAHMHGYKSNREILELNIWQLHPVSQHETLQQMMEQTIHTGQFYGTLEHIRKDGTSFPALMQVSILRDERDAPSAGVAIVQDLSRQRDIAQALRKSENRFRSLLEDLPHIAIQGFDKNGIVHYWNNASQRIYGYSSEEAIGRNIIDLIIPSEMKQQAQECIQEGLCTGNLPPAAEVLLQRKDGRRVPVFCSHSIVPVGENESQMFCVCIDLQDIKQAEAALRASLKEKEVLLREIHHRVKNNLQVISSLLRLQSRQTADEKARKMIAESEQRIRSMAMIHDDLYKSPRLSGVDFRQYAERLVGHLSNVFGTSPGKVTIDVRIPDLALSIDTAAACGLILNELVSNTLTHAFRSQHQGQVIVQVEPLQSGKYLLSVSDNGIGMEIPDTEFTPQTLGLQLVESLAQQLKGTLRIQSDRGTKVSVEFADTDRNAAGVAK